MTISKKDTYLYVCTLDKTPNKEYVFTYCPSMRTELGSFIASKKALGFGSYMTAWLSKHDFKRLFKDKSQPVTQLDNISDLLNVLR